MANGIGVYARELITAGKTNAEVLALVKAQFPNANTTAAGISFYRSMMKKGPAIVPSSVLRAQAAELLAKADAQDKEAEVKATTDALEAEAKAKADAAKAEATAKADAAKADALKAKTIVAEAKVAAKVVAAKAKAEAKLAKT